MSNPVKGEVTFEARGQTFTYKLGTNAQIMIETKTGMSMGQFFKDHSDRFNAADVRMIFHAGLYRQHKLTEEDVGDLIDEIGVERVAEIFKEAASAAVAAKKTNGAAEDDEARPTKATKERTGMNS